MPDGFFGSFFSGGANFGQNVLCTFVNAFCPEPTALFDYAFGRVLFFMIAFSNIFVALLTVSVLGGLVSRLRSPAWWLARTWLYSSDTSFAKLQMQSLSKPSLTVLLPAYLPNEEDILGGTIDHILDKLEYDYPFTLLVCYNTPKPMPEAEAKLRKLEGKSYRQGRTVKVLKVEGSTSKAENLNAALNLVTTERLVIYDADHHPDPHSLLIATAHMEAKSVSCVQGSTYLRARPTILANYINAEFFVTHFVFFPAMEFVAGLGVFGGSNALWRTEDLKVYEFRHDVQTEDIELSTRAMLGGKVRISFCPECRSGELPPATFLALYKQRLRWALGWDQVTLQHSRHIWKANLHWARKLGLYYLLPLRWALLFSATLNALITPIVTNIFHSYHPGASLGGPIDFAMALSFSGYVVVSITTCLNFLLHEPPAQWPAILAFQITGVLYIGWQLLLVIVSLTKIFTGGDKGWEVTARMLSSNKGSDGGNAPSGAEPSGAPAPTVSTTGETVATAPGSSSPYPLSPLAAAFNPLPGSRSYQSSLEGALEGQASNGHPLDFHPRQKGMLLPESMGAVVKPSSPGKKELL